MTATPVLGTLRSVENHLKLLYVHQSSQDRDNDKTTNTDHRAAVAPWIRRRFSGPLWCNSYLRLGELSMTRDSLFLRTYPSSTKNHRRNLMSHMVTEHRPPKPIQSQPIQPIVRWPGFPVCFGCVEQQ